MAGVNRRPPTDGGSATRVRAYRQARLVATGVERLADQDEEQLREVDDAVAGSDRDELQALRAEPSGELDATGRDSDERPAKR